MKPLQGPLVSAFGTAVVAFVFFLALSFGWSWWELLVVEAAVLAALFTCGGNTKERLEWECVGIFLSLAALGFVARRTELSVALVNIERFLANHAAAVQAVAAIVMALFTVALWQATRTQAEATRKMQELQRTLVAQEVTPLLVLDGVQLTYEPPHTEYESEEQPLGDPERVNMAVECVNLSKYGLVIKGVELFAAVAPERGVRCVARDLSRTVMGAGEVKNACPLTVLGCDLHSEQVRGVFGAFFDSPVNGRPRVFLRVKVEYAGAPGQIQSVCFEVQDIEARGFMGSSNARLQGRARAVECHPSWGDCCA